MPATVIVGCQWGDEGKGKIVDYLSGRMDWVARYSGGPNAGHTVKLGGEIFVLHLIPSGILRPGIRCVIGNGVVLDIDHLVEEINSLEKRGVGVLGRVFLSGAAHIIFPYHRWVEELQRQDVRVGTTRRGIGPAYQDKMGRNGIRLLELLDRRWLRERLDGELARVETLHAAYGRPMPQSRQEARETWSRHFSSVAAFLEPMIADTVTLLQDALDRGERVLCEGSQGTFLDIDLGTYPFVTSAPTTAGGAATGLGLAPRQLAKVIGIAKAYTTRVGNGPMPTEFAPALADRFRRQAGEFGATTGRPRRCGWLDLVLLRHAVRVNGIQEVCLTKLDVLRGFRSLKIATAYRRGRRTLQTPPLDAREWNDCRPVYHSMKGWSEPVTAARAWKELPAAARDYVKRIEESIGAPIRILSLGPGRESTFPIPKVRSTGKSIAARRR